MGAILFFVVMIVLILEANDFFNFIGIICIFLAKTAVDFIFYIVQIYILEYYATFVRCTSLGFIFYGIGSIALILSFIANIYIDSLWIMAMFYCISSIIGFLCARLLETETMHLPLRDHIKMNHKKNVISTFDYDYLELT